MLTIRRSEERGKGGISWLDSRFSFSFADFHDPRHMSFRSLRVMNEDYIDPSMGFDTHGHQNMEIVTIVLSGKLRHADNMGNEGLLQHGDIQYMCAGTGILHSEHNADDQSTLHLYQIWLLPERAGFDPGYEDRHFDPETAWKNQLGLVVSHDGRDGSLQMHQHADIFVSEMDKGNALSHTIGPGRHGWLQVTRGELALNGEAVREGDGVAISDESALAIEATEDAGLILFDLA